MHSAQDDNHLKKRLANLRKNFSPAFVENEETNLLKMRQEMLHLIKDFEPDMILEECGPYRVTPGDTWKAETGSEYTILEKTYPQKHLFVDAKLLKSGEKPLAEKREKEISNSTKKVLKKLGVNKIVLIIGSSHLENVEKLLKAKDLSIRFKDLKAKFFGNIKELLEKEKKLKSAQ